MIPLEQELREEAAERAAAFRQSNPLQYPNVKNNESLRGVVTLDDMRDAGLKDSGQKRVFESGAHRDDDSKKPRYDLLPLTALEKVAHHFAAGAAKYGENNWRKGIPRKEFLKSALRHLFQAVRGDEDEDHVVSCAWNVLCFIETRELNLDEAKV